jgi:hypothetical protein
MTDTDSTVPPAAPKGFARRNWGKLTILTLIFVPAAIFTIWAGVALNYTYSSGTRVGFVQKFSRKGWLCKTYEGELAQVNLPGALSQIFSFSVRDDSVAHAIERAMASSSGRVELSYRQHVGVPTRCFGETEYFVEGVKAIVDGK